jgi:putative Holliday junction resolvase
MYYLGIDWGKNKAGIAIADRENLIAKGYKQISTVEVFQEVLDFSQKEKVEKIIIGFYPDLSKNKEFQKFIKKIKKIGIILELEDENFSTQMAQKNLMDFKSKNVSQRDDMEAARIILQSWLDKLD